MSASALGVTRTLGASRQYPGVTYSTQSYRIGDHLYSTAGSESQRAPNRSTHCKLPYQWDKEHRDELKTSVNQQGLAKSGRENARQAVASGTASTQGASERSTAAIGQKVAGTEMLMGQLRDSAAAVENELAELEKTMDQTQAAIDSKKPSLAAVAAYTDLRKGRPASERLCDAVKSDLERMRATLLETVRLLESALAAQQSEKVRLEAHMRLLQADMEDKTAGV